MKKPLLERFQKLAGIKPLYEIDDASDGASGPGMTPPGDVEKAMKIIGQFINNRINQLTNWLSSFSGNPNSAQLNLKTCKLKIFLHLASWYNC